MPNWLKVLLLTIAVVVLSYLGAMIWWRAWMYEGLLGPIPFLHWFIPSDGEGSYMLTAYEMFFHMLGALVIVLFLSRQIRAKPGD